MEDAWSKLSPHRPLAEGDPQYAHRPEGSGAELAEAVRAGWKRIAVVGPMGVGKSTELAAAQGRVLPPGNGVTCRVGIDLTFDMRRIEAGEVFEHILTRLAKATGGANVELKRHIAHGLKGSDKRDVRRDLARNSLRSAGNAVLLVDGLEKADEAAARAVAEELFALSDDADIVLVVPASLAYGPGAATLMDDVRLFPVRAVLVWGEPREEAIKGRLFMREVAMRHLDRERLAASGPDATVLEIVDRASVVSGGVPRVLLQLLRDAHRHAVVARRATPSLDDLARAERDHGEQLRRSLLPGDRQVLVDFEGRDGGEIPLDRKLRFLLQGHLLEYRRGDNIVVNVAPTLANVLGIPQDPS